MYEKMEELKETNKERIVLDNRATTVNEETRNVKQKL